MLKKKKPIDLIFHFVKENIGMKKKKRNNQHFHIPETEKKINWFYLKKKEISLKKKKVYTGSCQVTEFQVDLVGYTVLSKSIKGLNFFII